MSRKKLLPSWLNEPDHPDGFPVVCCLSSVPVCIMDSATARNFLQRMEEARQRLETAIRVSEQLKGGEA